MFSKKNSNRNFHMTPLMKIYLPVMFQNPSFGSQLLVAIQIRGLYEKISDGMTAADEAARPLGAAANPSVMPPAPPFVDRELSDAARDPTLPATSAAASGRHR